MKRVSHSTKYPNPSPGRLSTCSEKLTTWYDTGNAASPIISFAALTKPHIEPRPFQTHHFPARVQLVQPSIDRFLVPFTVCYIHCKLKVCLHCESTIFLNPGRFNPLHFHQPGFSEQTDRRKISQLVHESYHSLGATSVIPRSIQGRPTAPALPPLNHLHPSIRGKLDNSH